MYELGVFVPRKTMSSEMSEVFSRRMRLSGIGQEVERRIEASEAECAALAALFNLPAIAALTGDFVLRHEQRGSIAARLTLRAKLTQICVITLEPFDAVVAEEAALRFIPAASIPEAAELVLDPETLEGPDEIPYAGESIDLGAVLAEQLALALDPYPKKPGATMPGEVTDATANPFAALQRLKDQDPLI
jgi:uncharacterized metal-binding protein YceD (DUF177 family)